MTTRAMGLMTAALVALLVTAGVAIARDANHSHDDGLTISSDWAGMQGYMASLTGSDTLTTDQATYARSVATNDNYNAAQINMTKASGDDWSRMLRWGIGLAGQYRAGGQRGLNLGWKDALRGEPEFADHRSL